MCQRNPKFFLPHPILPNTLSLSPQPSSSSVSGDILDPLHALPEIFPGIALVCRGRVSPAPAGARPFRIAHLSTGEGQLGSQGAGKPHRAELSLFPCPPKAVCLVLRR